MKVMREHGAAGFIVCPALGTDSTFLHEVEGWRLPLVTVMRRILGTGTSYVGPDNRRGAERATSYLIELGHRRIAFLGGRQGMVVQEERSAGYAAALEAAGLPPDPALIVEAVPNREGGRAALEAALALDDPPTAALCFNDVVAFGVLHGLAARGLRPGSDFAVIGFDDVQDARHMTLSTVAVDPPGLGERAAEILLQQVRHPATGPIEHHGEARLVVRASCGHADQGRRAWRNQSAGA
jgi:LacI family transcriptional regulator